MIGNRLAPSKLSIRFWYNVLFLTTKPDFQLFLFQAFQAASKYEKAIRNDKHIMSFAIYELAVIHISRDEVMNDMNY